MDTKIIDYLTNPITCKLLMEIHSIGQTTAKHLSDTYSDIPQASLYRHLKRMTADGILKIVEEKPVRGTVERTYSLAFDIGANFKEILDKNSGQAYMQTFLQYIFGFVEQFEKYCNSPNIKIEQDKSGFSLAPIYVSDDELLSFMTKLSELLQPFLDNKPAKDRKLRSIGIIVSPPQKL